DAMSGRRAGRGRMSVSRLDRERAIAVLKAAFVQGRLTKDEFDLRVGQALAAGAVAELAALTADIPAGLVKAQRRPESARVQARPRVSKVAAASACVVIAAAVLGLLAGIAFTLFSPPVFRSSAYVMLPVATRDTATQAVIARSDPVLAGALPSIKPAVSLPALRSGIQVKRVGSRVISISA